MRDDDLKLPAIYSIARWLEDHWIDTARETGTVVLVLAGVALSDEMAGKLVGESWIGLFQVTAFVLLIVVGVVQLALGIVAARRTDRISRIRAEMQALRAENDSLRDPMYQREVRVASLIFDYLRVIGQRDFEIGGRAQEAGRLTLYLHDAVSGGFVPIGRYSNSPTLGRAGRARVPDDQGVLRRVWLEGVYTADGFPDPAKDLDAYKAHWAQQGLTREVIRQLRMYPRIYAGVAIWNTDKSRQVGVLMFESTAASRYSKQALRDTLKRYDESGFVASLCEEHQRVSAVETSS